MRAPGASGTTGRDSRSRGLPGHQARSHPLPLADTIIGEISYFSLVSARECSPARAGSVAELSPTQAFEMPYWIGFQGCLSRGSALLLGSRPGHVERTLLCVCMCRKQAELAVLLPLASRASGRRGLFMNNHYPTHRRHGNMQI